MRQDRGALSGSQAAGSLWSSFSDAFTKSIAQGHRVSLSHQAKQEETGSGGAVQGGRGAALGGGGGFKTRTGPGSGNPLAARPPDPARSARCPPCGQPGPLALTAVGMSAAG